ncbi:hypothetical protein AKJ40_02930, partial [candidate division MSBL1 archaeon SCGC-AAA259M10]
MEVSDIRKRMRSFKKDYIMPIYLPFIPAIISFLGMFFAVVLAVLGWRARFPFGAWPPMRFPWSIAGIVSIIVVLALVSLAAGIIGIYVLYKWIDRRNEHFKRVRFLYEDIIDFLKEKGAEKEAKGIQRELREMESQMDVKSAPLWIVLTIVFPPVIFYVLHFLTRDYFD